MHHRCSVDGTGDTGGKWATVLTYTDKAPGSQSDTETWLTHNTTAPFPAGKGAKVGEMIMIKIVPTNVGWSGFNTWGQLAVDYIALYWH